MGIEPSAHICIGRARGRIERTHAAVTDRRDQHGKQRDQDNGDEVPVRKFLRDAIKRNGGDRLDEHDAVEDQVPKAQNAFQARRRRSGRGGFHLAY